jgi:hypothetical protein
MGFHRIKNLATKRNFEVMSVKSQVNNICKGKAVPLQAWGGPEGSRRLRLLDFKTSGTGRW